MATVARRNEVANLDAFARRVIADRRRTAQHAEAHVLRALVRWTLQDTRGAHEAAEQALVLRPDQANALAVRGVCMMALGDPARGLRLGLEPALARRPDDLWTLLQTARAQELAGQDARPTWQALGCQADKPLCPPWLRNQAKANGDLLAPGVHADAA